MTTSIGDYGFLSDSHGAALVHRTGSVDWYCVPRFDSPAVFARLLDKDAGHWSITPRGRFKVQRRYVGHSLVLRTVFRTSGGEAALTDALALEPGSRQHDIGKQVPHVLLRRIEGIQGAVDFEMEFAPCFEYGLTLPYFLPSHRGVLAVAGPLSLELSANVALDVQERVVKAAFTVHAGESTTFSLAYAPSYGRDRPRSLDVAAALHDTSEAWESWMGDHQGYRGAYTEMVRRSALVLQGLTYQPSGAVIAAATTSLPEVLGGHANWDYRYAWLRDLSLTMRAQWVAACPDEAGRFFSFVARAAGQLREGPIQIMFGVEGERNLAEHELSHLSGFRESRPVRVGNVAWQQKQLDVTGEVLDSAHLLRDVVEEFDATGIAMLISLADIAASSWKEPDAGMWEARDRERHYLSSKVLCWVALDRAVKLGDRLKGADVGTWADARDEVRQAVLENGWSERAGAYTGAFGSDELDASVLLMPLVDFVPATDPRMRATIEAIERGLGDGRLIRRWTDEPNSFLITTYWLAECLALAGEIPRAKNWFDGATDFANDLGLLAEEADPSSGELLGNFPQAFSHVGLINAAWRLTELGVKEDQPHRSGEIQQSD